MRASFQRAGLPAGGRGILVGRLTGDILNQRVWRCDELTDWSARGAKSNKWIAEAYRVLPQEGS